MTSPAVLGFLPENILISFFVIFFLLAAILLNFIVSTLKEERPFDAFPILSLPEKGLDPKRSWIEQGRALVAKGSKLDKPFQVITGTGPKIVLPNRFADELKSDSRLSFTEAFDKEFFFDYPGFEAFRYNAKEGGFLPELVRTKLTISLGLITEDLVDETTASIHSIFGEDMQWHEIQLKQCVLQLVARLSSRVFLGQPLCRNQRWLEIAKDYTTDAMEAARALRATPSLLRPVLQWILAPMRRLRKHVRDAERLIKPEIDMRRTRAQKAMEKGQKPPKTADTIGWMYELAREKGRREELSYVAAQLSLTMAAVHTTTEAITTAILDLCQHPEVVVPLREEIVEVIETEGWSKQALYKLKKMDSFLKESQRMAFGNAVNMNRMVKKSITLSDGTVLPANSRVMLIGENMNQSVYADADAFDPWRFLKARQTAATQNAWQHVTLQDASQLSFGWGKHACPGRFFASNELKIALCHLLLKYDWESRGGENAFWQSETLRMVKPSCVAKLRRREEEVILDLEEKAE